MLKVYFLVACFIVQAKNGFCSYFGDEESLRRNIADLVEGKIDFSTTNLPFETDELSDFTAKNQSEYDFIVIGAGSAGATIASRLSEIKNFSVLLIEAGGTEYSILDVPILNQYLWSNSETVWHYDLEIPDGFCLGTKDRKCKWIAGRVIGGGSTINQMIAVRGNRRDYDEWAAEVDDQSWSFESMLKYFKKLENFHSDDRNINKEYHNEGGPIHLTLASRHPTISKAFVEAGKEMGFSEVDTNGPEQVGFSHAQGTVFNGERSSANRGYLRPAKNRKNLMVSQHSHVHKVLIDKATKIAYGVRFSKNGKIYEVKAKKEVILSAGALNSPQILMLSGIGPKEHLREFNIDVVQDAPVGENFANHVMYDRLLRFSVNDSSNFVVPNIFDTKDSSVKEYIDSKTGPLSYGIDLTAVSFVNVDDHSDLRPNIKIGFMSGDFSLTGRSEITDKTYILEPMLLRPRSRGKIVLRSNDPLDRPKIYPNYFEDHDDVRVLIQGIRFALNITETMAMKKHGSVNQGGSLSPCDSKYEKDSDEYWECELRHYAKVVAHCVGTCRMGRKDSKTAVVDPQLKVIGVKGLRVADVSVIPNDTCAHTNLPAIAIGEKAADLIKAEYGYN